MKTKDKRVVARLDPPKGMGPLNRLGRVFDQLRPDGVAKLDVGYRRVLIPYTATELRDSKHGLRAHIQIMRDKK